MPKYGKIRVLSELEHIRLRPSMYIGSLETPTHLFHEVFDNSLDEAIGGHATQIHITLDEKTHRIGVCDNGRGIPQNYNKEFKMHEPVLVAMKLHSGGKFDKDSYQTAIGLHGIGLVAVNALSEAMEIWTKRDAHRFCVVFDNGLPGSPNIEDWNKDDHGTTVSFIPSAKYFTSLEFDKMAIENRIRLALTFIKGLCITFNGTIVQPWTEKDLCPNTTTNVLSTEFKDGLDLIRVYLGYNESTQNRNFSRGSVNLLEVNYGSHIRVFERALKDAWMAIVDTETRKFLQEDDYLCGLRGYTFVQLANPSYTSQTKDTLGGSVRNYSNLVNGLSKNIERVLNANPKIVEKLLLKFKDYRASLNKLSSSQYFDQVVTYGSDDVVDRSVILDSKLIDCTSNDRDKTELFVVEGDSAGGGIIPLRDPRVHAVLPLRGKIMNVVDVDMVSILNNLEVRSLINSIGCGCLQREDVSKIRYSHIIIAGDADVDGQNIAALVLGALCYLTPKVVMSGHVYIADMPLFGQYTDTVEIELDDGSKRTFRLDDLVKVSERTRRVPARCLQTGMNLEEDSNGIKI